ncbi:hypothetical protein [Aliivibrio fischeri]|uniref:hypothetical protein n=1 Tax=Aliivibrio fischeri TaxID=668 RepID=UPI000A83E7EE|nr:hypothetical protein [Aliivibrio fischeri]
MINSQDRSLISIIMFSVTSFFKAFSVALILSVCAVLFALWQHSSSQLNYASRDMDWEWSWMYYEPFSNGIQTTRTKDTKQLLFRRVNTSSKLTTVVNITYTNKLEIIVTYEDSCVSGSFFPATLKLNQTPQQQINFQCEKNGRGYLFRRTANQLTSVQIKSDKFELKENFSEWPIDELKKDQFIQQHSNFFKEKGQSDVYEWSRD